MKQHQYSAISHDLTILFIVNNSVSGWTGLRYLEEWSGIARALDMATGYFEIGSLLALGGSLEDEKQVNPFLHGVPGNLEFDRMERALQMVVSLHG